MLVDVASTMWPGIEFHASISYHSVREEVSS